MLIRCVRAFIGLRLQEGIPSREILKLINRVADFSQTAHARRVAALHAVHWEDSVPLDIIQAMAAAEPDSALTHFLSEFLPRWRAALSE
jgi:hypothetical protein